MHRNIIFGNCCTVLTMCANRSVSVFLPFSLDLKSSSDGITFEFDSPISMKPDKRAPKHFIFISNFSFLFTWKHFFRHLLFVHILKCNWAVSSNWRLQHLNTIPNSDIESISIFFSIYQLVNSCLKIIFSQLHGIIQHVSTPNATDLKYFIYEWGQVDLISKTLF